MVSEYKSDKPPSDLNAPFLSALCTELYADKPAVAFLPQPNMLTGLPAQSEFSVSIYMLGKMRLNWLWFACVNRLKYDSEIYYFSSKAPDDNGLRWNFVLNNFKMSDTFFGLRHFYLSRAKPWKNGHIQRGKLIMIRLSEPLEMLFRNFNFSFRLYCSYGTLPSPSNSCRTLPFVRGHAVSGYHLSVGIPPSAQTPTFLQHKNRKANIEVVIQSNPICTNFKRPKNSFV